MASRLPWNRPGASAEPTSAIVSTVMSVGVMPASVACSVADAHGLGAVDDVVAPAAAVVAGAAVTVGLVGLLREHAPAITHTATRPATIPARFSGLPVVQ